MGKTVILEGARTPFGKLNGGLSSLSASQLGGTAITEALKRADIGVDTIDHVLLGTVLQGGQGQLPSRQAARNANIPWETKTETINKVCASGMRSVALAKKARTGYRMGHSELVDLMIYDGLTCSFTGAHMGNYGNGTAEELGMTREEQDEWSYRSHQRALAAIESGKLGEEIVPVEIPQRKGEPMIVSVDEAPRKDTSIEKLAKLKPAFDPKGTITAGNAPGVNDGACALVLMDEEKAEQEGRKPLAKILANESIAVEAKDFPKTPGLVINKLLEKVGKTADDIDLFEINEAFAAVALASIKIARLDPEKVNVNGGAVALGHPIGASGARIILTLAYELKRRGGGLGIAAICSGGGQGDAILIEVPKQ